MARLPKLPPNVAKQKILLILQTGTIEKSWHCENESMPERRVDDNDLLYLLRHGKIREKAKFDRGRWQYRVEGADVEGEELTAITVLEDDKTLYVITVF